MNLLKLKLNTTIADPMFVIYLLRTSTTRKFINDNAQRAIGQASLNISALSSLTLPFPPLFEQQRIAAVLKGKMAVVNRARKTAEEALQTINAMPAAFLRQAFSGGL